MNDQLDWDGFRVLLAVVDAGSFSAAARTLGISQPTAGRKVLALEQTLGTRLLLRRTHGVALTQAGEQILADVRRMAEGARGAVRNAHDDDPERIARVRISASERLGALWLPQRLLPLARAHPSLRIELVIDNAAVDLARRQADIAVRLFRPREPDLMMRRVGTLSFALFAAPSYLKARGTPRRLADLARHDLIGFSSDLPSQASTNVAYVGWLEKLVPEPRFVLRTASLIAQQEAARAGFGIVVGAEKLLEHEAGLQKVLPRARIPPLEIWLAVHADVRRNAAVARVHDHLVTMFAREPLG
jgi:molybdate transport repressor ModE-like protein